MNAFAPYNFIPFSEHEIPEPYNEKESFKHFNRFEEETYTGDIEYILKNVKEMHIGSGEKKAPDNQETFFRDGYGRISIPGSTIRGLLRSNSEILSFSYPEFIDNETYLYRSFADNCHNIKEEYGKEMSASSEGGLRIPDGVKAGYIYWDEHEQLIIQPVKEFGSAGTTFFSIHENDLRTEECLNVNEYMYTQLLEPFVFSKQEEYLKKIKDCNDSEERKKIKGKMQSESLKEYSEQYIKKIKKNKNASYMPYQHKKVRFSINNKIPKLCKDGGFSGTLVNSAYIDGKTHHFLVSAEEDTTKDSIKIEFDLAYSFLKDYKNRKKFLKEKSFYNLPMDGDNPKLGKKYKKLFFYKEADEKTGKRLVGFGATPYFRIFYKKDVKSCLQKESTFPVYDYVNSMFGYIYSNKKSDERKTEHYKSRINVSNCILVNSIKNMNIRKAVLMSPRGTSFQLYLKQKGKSVKIKGIKGLATYNAEEAKLRGYKFYWKRNEPKESSNGPVSTFETISPGVAFTGKIYFENLTKDELGLLICALKLSKNEQQMIGKGKPYGYGTIEIQKIKLNYFYHDNKSKELKKYFLSAEGTLPTSIVVDYQSNGTTGVDGLQEFRKAYTDRLKNDFELDFNADKSIQLYRNVHKRETVVSSNQVYMNAMQNRELNLKNQFKSRNPLSEIEELFDRNGNFREYL